MFRSPTTSSLQRFELLLSLLFCCFYFFTLFADFRPEADIIFVPKTSFNLNRSSCLISYPTFFPSFLPSVLIMPFFFSLCFFVSNLSFFPDVQSSQYRAKFYSKHFFILLLFSPFRPFVVFHCFTFYAFSYRIPHTMCLFQFFVDSTEPLLTPAINSNRI